MTSVTHSSIHGSHPAKKAERSTASAADAGLGSGLPGEFSALFGAISQLLPRQDLAAPAAATGKASPPPGGLASEVLGPSVQIITAAEPATSDESLLAFARAQGMDESSLALIFGQPATLPAAAQTAATALPQPDAGVSAAASALTNTAAASPLPAGLWPGSHPAFARPDLAAMAGAADAARAVADAPSSPGTAGTGPAHAAPPATAPLPPLGGAPSTAPSGSLDLGADASVRWSVGDAASAAAVAKALPPLLFGLNGVRAALQTAETGETAAASTTTTTPPEQQPLAASLMLGAAEASQFARRLQARQATQRAEGKDSVPANAAGASASTGEADGDVVTDLLTLDVGMNDTDLQQLLQAAAKDPGQPPSDSRQPAGGNTAGAGASAAAARTDLEQRAEQYEQLSQRLGEALGHRLAAQIAKGDWKVEMALRPHDLGRIDIELNMKNGGLEASFSASEALTRDLIADGLPKLREVLGQLGMDVASVNVNVRQNSQHGGNPTPGRQSPRVAGVGATRGPGTESAAAEVRPAPRAGSTDDGLDVLV